MPSKCQALTEQYEQWSKNYTDLYKVFSAAGLGIKDRILDTVLRTFSPHLLVSSIRHSFMNEVNLFLFFPRGFCSLDWAAVYEVSYLQTPLLSLRWIWLMFLLLFSQPPAISHSKKRMNWENFFRPTPISIVLELETIQWNWLVRRVKTGKS